MYENSGTKCVEELLEWVALVCSLSDKPLSNFTTSFVNNEPFDCIFRFYFPRKDAAFVQKHKEALPNIFGFTHCSQILMTDNSHVKTPRELLDMRVIVMTLALLASRVLSNNDRIEVKLRIHFIFT